MATIDAYTNFPAAQVLTPPSPPTSGTTLVLASGHGAYMPPVPFNATVCAGTAYPTPPTAEIVRVTARTSDTLTITRAQEGTTARSILATDYVLATITAKTLDDLRDAGNVNAGTLADARLSANVPRLNGSQTFLGSNTFGSGAVIISGNGLGRLTLIDTARPTDHQVWDIDYSSEQLLLRPVTNAGAGIGSPAPLLLDRNGNATIGQDVYEKGRTTPLGHWIAVPFSAANFGATGGTWTVSAGNIQTFQYALLGKTACIHLSLAGSIFTGTASVLTVMLPVSVSLAPAGIIPVSYVANSVQGTAFHVYTNSGQLVFYKDPFGGSWTDANPLNLYVSITLPLL